MYANLYDNHTGFLYGSQCVGVFKERTSHTLTVISHRTEIHDYMASVFSSRIVTLWLSVMNKTCLRVLFYSLQMHLQGLAHARCHVHLCWTKNRQEPVSPCYKAAPLFVFCNATYRTKWRSDAAPLGCCRMSTTCVF